METVSAEPATVTRADRFSSARTPRIWSSALPRSDWTSCAAGRIRVPDRPSRSARLDQRLPAITPRISATRCLGIEPERQQWRRSQPGQSAEKTFWGVSCISRVSEGGECAWTGTLVGGIPPPVLVQRARHLRKSKAHAKFAPTATCVTTGTLQCNEAPSTSRPVTLSWRPCPMGCCRFGGRRPKLL